MRTICGLYMLVVSFNKINVVSFNKISKCLVVSDAMDIGLDGTHKLCVPDSYTDMRATMRTTYLRAQHFVVWNQRQTVDFSVVVRLLLRYKRHVSWFLD